MSRYAYDEEALRPYFSLPKVLEGMQLGEHWMFSGSMTQASKSALHHCIRPERPHHDFTLAFDIHRQRFGIASKLFAVDIVQDDDAAERILPALRGWQSDRKWGLA